MTRGVKRTIIVQGLHQLSELITLLQQFNLVWSFQVKLVPSSIALTKEEFDLYRRYQIGVHHDAPERLTGKVFENFLLRSPIQVPVITSVFLTLLFSSFICGGDFVLCAIRLLWSVSIPLNSKAADPLNMLCTTNTKPKSTAIRQLKWANSRIFYVFHPSRLAAFISITEFPFCTGMFTNLLFTRCRLSR